MTDTAIKVNTSVPVSILGLPESNFNEIHKNDFVTHAKLKIFYIGETADGRQFTKDFSEKLIKTLPQSPVVGYYDDNDEDFKAHNYKQYVYGYVPETAEITFQEEGDKTWAFTDVVLFTGRKDNIGQVASKIIGMQHSLELDPDTVEYLIHRDENGKFKGVEFIDGKFIGLSVVGDSEQPAFTGSHFFTVENEEEMLKAFTSFKNDINMYFAKNNGGAEMDTKVTEENLVVEDTNVETPEVEEAPETQEAPEAPEVQETFTEEDPENTPEEETPEETNNFMKTPYSEVQQEVYGQFYEAFGDYAYIMQWSIDEKVIVFWNGEDGNHYRVDFTEGEDGKLEFGEKIFVKPRYLTQEEIDTVFVEQTNTEGGQDGEQEEPKQEGILLTESEAAQLEKDMAELQGFRRKEKELMIEGFAGMASDEDIAAIKENIDNLSKEEIESKIAVSVLRKMKNEKEEDSKVSVMRVYNENQNENQENQNPTLDLINRWKDKK